MNFAKFRFKIRLQKTSARMVFANFLKFIGTYFDALLEFSKGLQKYWRKKFPEYLSVDGCFVKTNTINCDDNDDATCFLILGSS